MSASMTNDPLVRKKYELPAFDTLARPARHIRAGVYHQFYRHVEATLTPQEQARIEALFVPEPETRFTPWNTLKQEPDSPTLTHLKLWLDRQVWLAQFQIALPVLEGIPDVKVKHCAAEARTLDAARMAEIEPRKRLTLAASLLRVQSVRVLDDLAEMLIKRLSSIHHKGKDALGRIPSSQPAARRRIGAGFAKLGHGLSHRRQRAGENRRAGHAPSRQGRRPSSAL